MGGLDAATRELVPELIAEVLAADGAVLVSDHRGETIRLPAARRWLVADGSLTEETSSADETFAVVEVAVPAARVAGTVARLRAEGHHVLGVRADASTAAAQARPAAPSIRSATGEPTPGQSGADQGVDPMIEPAAGEAR